VKTKITATAGIQDKPKQIPLLGYEKKNHMLRKLGPIITLAKA